VLGKVILVMHGLFVLLLLVMLLLLFVLEDLFICDNLVRELLGSRLDQ
jgi:hypothetical protein